MDQTFFFEQQNMPTKALYVVGTPIGNLGDISYRAVHILKTVDGIACEDTRHTAHLLNVIGVHKPLLAIHEHNEMTASLALINKLLAGERWAYVCDAGTPSISDPGAKLVNAVKQAGLQIVPVPGASAVTTLLSVAGQLSTHSSGGFQFLGFLPLKGKERLNAFLQINKSALATVFYESPQRVCGTLRDLHLQTEDLSRMLVVGREMTKKFETISHMSLRDIPSFLDHKPEERGEFCVVVGGTNKVALEGDNTPTDMHVDIEVLARLMAVHLGSKHIAEVLSKCGPISKKLAYEIALKVKAAPTDL